MSDDTSETLRRHVWGRRGACLHKLRVSALYHLRHARFFEICDRIVTAFAIIASAGAVLSMLQPLQPLLGPVKVEIWLAGAVTIVSTIGLVFAFSQKARTHTELARDFRRLLAAIERAGQYPREEQVDGFTADAIELDSLEPSPLNALLADCENQLAIGFTGKPIVQIPLAQRLLMHIWSFTPITPPEQKTGVAAAEH